MRHYEKDYDYNPHLRRKIEIIDLIVVLLFLIILLLGLLNYNSLEGTMANAVKAGGMVALFLISAIIDFFPTFFNPLMFTAASVAAGLNVHVALALTVAGSFTGCFLGFEVGYRKGFKYVAVLFEPKVFYQVEGFFKKYGKWFLLIVAFTPLPDFMMVFGAFHIPRKDFFIFGLAARMIGLIIFGYALYYGIKLF